MECGSSEWGARRSWSWTGRSSETHSDRDEAIEVTEAFNDALAPDDVCGVVLTGNGAFCAGGNLKGMAERSGMPEDERRKVVYGAYQGLIRAIVGLPVTTIAAIDGPAVGLGLDLALGV